ncbi:MAG: peptidoglycan-binding protein [Chthoniobacterales bacterium]
MKKFTNLLIVASLALAGAVMAQQPSPDESQPPGKKTDKKAPAEVKPPKAPHAPKTEAPAAPKTEAPKVKEPAAAAQPPAANEPAVKEPAATKQEKKAPKNKKETPPAAPSTNAEQPAPNAPAVTPPATKQEHNAKNSKKAPPANTSPSVAPAAPKTAASPAATTPASTPAVAATTPPAKTTPATSVAPTTPATTPAVTASTPPAATSPAASVAPSVAQSNAAGAKKRPEPQKIEQIRQQHASFRAQPKPDRVPAVTFSAGFRLPGVETWSGPRYEVYRSYHPERHDRGWYHSHYQRVELVAGGYYYFNNGYWYPAWGYDSGHEYYAYDAPIYSGKHAEPPDKVIADVQAALQEMGYYKGEVDGLIGPLTREALTGYQRDNGITVTAVIDEPTLDALGMS